MTQKFLRDDGSFVPLASTGSSASGPVTLLTKSSTADLTNASSTVYVDGPSVTQGTSGIWLAMGTVSLTSTNAIFMQAKLWDGTTTIASLVTVQAFAGLGAQAVSLSGVIANPAGDIRISFTSQGGFTTTLRSNWTGSNKDSTITAIRIG